MDGGLRILPSAMFFKFREEMKEPIAAYNAAVDTFAERDPELVKKAPKRLGDLARTYVLPSETQIKWRFRLKQNLLPVPNTADFRADWADDEAASIEQQVTADFQALTTKAVQDVWLRLSEMIGKIAETMGGANKKFRNTIITNLKDFCILIPKFNITNDANLEQIRKDVMKKLTDLDPEDLREIPNNRKKAAKDAKELMNKISQYIK